jgi:hypothetical protein
MSTARSHFQTEVLNEKIHAIGGINLSSVEVYDPSTNVWTSFAPISTARGSFQAEVIDGKIYIIYR